MKKLLIPAVLVSVMAVSSVAEAKSIPIHINNSGSALENSAIENNGKIYLPLHDIAYAAGDRVRYDSEAKTAYIIKNGVDYACFCTGTDDTALGNDQYKAVLTGDKIYITPENYVRVFGGSVAWDKDSNVIDITEKNYRLGLDEIQLFRPAETIVKTDAAGNIYVEVCEEYSETMELSKGISEYTKDVEEGRIPIVSLLKTYYGIDYSITQAFKNKPTATITLKKDNETYVYTIHFKECSD